MLAGRARYQHQSPKDALTLRCLGFFIWEQQWYKGEYQIRVTDLIQQLQRADIGMLEVLLAQPIC